ncbi:MAG: nucleotidyl transferase AbiEii/AbiGii toxin family protein [Chloroflexi bacterium]|nr:nucleotidyl transferase AbiEii/AbiGii toxin family protein [Chloroflexota bacterium]
MKYKTAVAFRAALETRLLNQSRERGLPLVRLRKAIAFDRLLARLVSGQPGVWVLKGGYALQLRLEHAHDVRPRTTRDVDLQTVIRRESVREALIRAARIDLGDWVQFDISELTAPRDDEQALEHGALRSQVEMLLDGRHFETFNVDVGLHDPMPQQVDILTLPPLLEFAGVLPVQVPCYPLTQHIAEKVHAYTHEYASGPSTRVKDLVDLLLIAELGMLNAVPW